MPKEGWYSLVNARKWHYFVDRRSLCGKWMVLWLDEQELERGFDVSFDNCKACQRNLAKRKAKGLVVKPDQVEEQAE